MCCCAARPFTRSESWSLVAAGRPLARCCCSCALRPACLTAATRCLVCLAPRCRYEKYDTNAAVRQKTDDPFADEFNMVLDKVQDLQLVRGGGTPVQLLPASTAASLRECTLLQWWQGRETAVHHVAAFCVSQQLQVMPPDAHPWPPMPHLHTCAPPHTLTHPTEVG